MKLQTKTELANHMGLGVGTLGTLLVDIDASEYSIGLRKYYDIAEIEEKLKAEKVDTDSTNDSFLNKKIDNSIEYHKLKKQVEDKLKKNIKKLNTIQKQVDGLEQSKIEYIDKRLQSMESLIAELKDKNISPALAISFVIDVMGINIYGIINGMIGEYIEDGDNDKLIELNYKNRGVRKFSLRVRDGIALKISPLKNFREN